MAGMDWATLWIHNDEIILDVCDNITLDRGRIIIGEPRVSIYSGEAQYQQYNIFVEQGDYITLSTVMVDEEIYIGINMYLYLDLITYIKLRDPDKFLYSLIGGMKKIHIFLLVVVLYIFIMSNMAQKK